MIVRYVLPMFAFGLLLFAIVYVMRSRWEPLPEPVIVAEPARSPFDDTLAGAGMVEPRTENISLGSPEPGLVAEVLVRVGQSVEANTPLFRLDERQLRGELQVRRSALMVAEAERDRLENQPREEQVPIDRARVREAEAVATERSLRLYRYQRLLQREAITEEQFETEQQASLAANAALERVQAELTLTEAGAWRFDLEVARAQVARASADVAQVETELERRVIRAPIDGQVLQVNVRPGEFVGAPPSEPLIVLGNIRPLHVRVDIDEHDIPRFRPGAPAVAVLRGHPHIRFPLRFVHVEPFVIPKRSLTGETTERIDTRVLQVIFEVESNDQPLYVGQLVDVFIDAGSEIDVEIGHGENAPIGHAKQVRHNRHRGSGR